MLYMFSKKFNFREISFKKTLKKYIKIKYLPNKCEKLVNYFKSFLIILKNVKNLNYFKSGIFI